MGVKSTKVIKREAAEFLYVELKINDELRRKLRAEAVVMTDKELEDALERQDDKNCDGESFNNYLIEA